MSFDQPKTKTDGNNNIQCYGCQKLMAYNEQAYECMCFRDEKPQYRGVCKPCAENKVSLTIENPEHHTLHKIHTFSDKNTQLWKYLDRDYPTWSGFTFDGDGNMVVGYYETPDGNRDRDSVAKCMSNGTTVRKTVTIPVQMADLHCTCCVARAEDYNQEL